MHTVSIDSNYCHIQLFHFQFFEQQQHNKQQTHAPKTWRWREGEWERERRITSSNSSFQFHPIIPLCRLLSVRVIYATWSTTIKHLIQPTQKRREKMILREREKSWRIIRNSVEVASKNSISYQVKHLFLSRLFHLANETDGSHIGVELRRG